ncbi:hypothetical protein [Streptomyces axinellae]
MSIEDDLVDERAVRRRGSDDVEPAAGQAVVRAVDIPAHPS